MRLEQIDDPHSSVPRGNARLVRAEVDGFLEIRDGLIDRTGEELAPAETRISRSAAAVERDCPLVFGNGLLTARLREQNLPLYVMRQRTVRRRRQGLRHQPFGAVQVLVGRIAEIVGYAVGERGRQPGCRIRRLRVER